MSELQKQSNPPYRSVWKYLHKVPHYLGWIDVDGVSTRYIEMGPKDKPVVILLHGTAGSLENFAANFRVYAQHFHVFAIDMIGCGWTDKPDFPYEPHDYAAHVVGFMNRLGIERASFVGVSLGSWIACRLAADFPGRADRIISIAPAGIIVDQKAADDYIAGVRKRRSGAASSPTWDSIYTIFKALVLKEEDIIDDLVAIRLEIYQNPAMQGNMANLLHMTKGNQRLSEDEWRSLPNHILTVAAIDKDDMFKPNAYRIAELVPNGQVIEVPGCDHWVQFEQPDAFNDFSIKYLKGEAVPTRISLGDYQAPPEPPRGRRLDAAR